MARAAAEMGGVEGKTFWRVPDRGEAIRLAVQMAQPGDLGDCLRQRSRAIYVFSASPSIRGTTALPCKPPSLSVLEYLDHLSLLANTGKRFCHRYTQLNTDRRDKDRYKDGYQDE